VSTYVARKEVALKVALFYSVVALLIGVYVGYTFDKSVPGFQFLSSYSVLTEYNLSLTFGADGISMVFLLLTLFVYPVCFIAA
jgi:NADH-quinone oxidoreductase subunit M